MNNDIRSAIKNGFIYIFSTSVINKVVQFCIFVVFVRLLTKEAYGSLTYALNILDIFLLFKGIGSVMGILQYCSAEPTEEGKLSFFKYGLKVGFMFNLILALLIFVFTYLFELPVKGSSQILRWLAFTPLLIIFFEGIQFYLRAVLKNKEFSWLSVINTILFFGFSYILGKFYGIEGIVWARYLGFIISLAVAIYMIKDYLEPLKKVAYPTLKAGREFVSYSLLSVITTSISQIMFLIDVFLIGMIIQDQSIVASYKNATLIPFALNFIPTSVVTYVYPYFAQNAANKEWIKKKYLSTQNILMILNGVISVGLIVFAPLIIRVFFGSEYMDALVPFRILSVSYFVVGTFRILTGNILASIRKVKVNLVNAIVTSGFNVILSIFLITRFGTVGAALSTLTVGIISSLISNLYLLNYLKIKKAPEAI